MKPNTTCRRAIAVLLSLAMILSAQHSIQAQASDKPESPPESSVVLPACVAVGIVVGIGAGGIYVIYRLCQNLPPPPEPPPPPPPPPPLPPSTNAPPQTNGLMSGYWVPPQWAGFDIMLTNCMTDPPSGALYDIRSLGYMDTNGASPILCHAYATGVISNVLSSTDLVNWSHYTFRAWISSNGIDLVLYDGTGVPVLTNYACGDAGGATNAISLGTWIDAEPQKFFRIMIE